MTDKIGPTKLFRNPKTGKRVSANEESNEDFIRAERNENDEAINAENRVPKEEFNKQLDDDEIEADYNTVPFTVDGGKVVERKRPNRL
jgi:hypothetical protein